MRLANKVANFFQTRPYILYLLLLVITFSFFAYLQWWPAFADPDSFYHAKMALQLVDQGATTEFPWLSATTLKYDFVDHHFLYHLALIPFVKLLPPLIGLKVATAIFATLAILFIFWFLRQLKIRGAFWYMLFLLTINPFIFRLNLAKAQALAIILFFLIIYLLFKRHYLALILACCFYVWLYGGWPIALVLVLVLMISNWLWLRHQSGWLSLRFKLGKSKYFKQHLLLFFSVVLGLFAGLFFSPYFPKNLNFYWQQSFKIAVINYQSIIGVGGEWYPYPLTDLFLSAIPLFLFLIFAIATFLFFIKKQTTNNWFLLILTFIFFGLTLKSRRYVEYFIPLAFCFSAGSINVFINSAQDSLSKLIPKRYFALVPIVLLLLFSPFFYRDLAALVGNYRTGFSFDKFVQPMEWLKQNSNYGDIVFHTDWDEFPILFYNDDKNYYLVGLDPTFMYAYDKNLYQRWYELVTAKTKENLYPTIKKLFGASYVFVDIKQNSEFDKNLSENFYFKKVFSNSEASVYQVN
ncbi:MAG: hypothetical protein WC508_04400 [Patescibacteria group bacterium]